MPRTHMLLWMQRADSSCPRRYSECRRICIIGRLQVQLACRCRAPASCRQEIVRVQVQVLHSKSLASPNSAKIFFHASWYFMKTAPTYGARGWPRTMGHGPLNLNKNGWRNRVVSSFCAPRPSLSLEVLLRSSSWRSCCYCCCVAAAPSQQQNAEAQHLHSSSCRRRQ